MRPGGQPNMQQLMKQAQKMQQELLAAQEELAAAEVTGSAGGGLVTATVTGSGELRSVTIDPTVVDPDDMETLQDLVVAAGPAPQAPPAYDDFAPGDEAVPEDPDAPPPPEEVRGEDAALRLVQSQLGGRVVSTSGGE